MTSTLGTGAAGGRGGESAWRRGPLRAVAAVTALAVAGVLAYGLLAVPDRPGLVEVPVAVPGLDPGWAGAELGVLADLHVAGDGSRSDVVQRAVALLVAREPAAVLVAGGLLAEDVDDPQQAAVRVLELLEPLSSAGIPVVAVLGESDRATGFGAELSARLESVGIEVLRTDLAVLGEDSARPPLAVVPGGAAPPPAAPHVVLAPEVEALGRLGPTSLAVVGDDDCDEVVARLGGAGAVVTTCGLDPAGLLPGFGPAPQVVVASLVPA